MECLAKLMGDALRKSDGGKPMNQLLQRLIMLVALCILFLTAGVAFVAAQGPDNTSQTQQTEVEGVRPLEDVTVEAGETAFTVSWKTKTAETGWVEYGTAPDALDVVAYDEGGQDVVDIRHQVVVDNLEPGMGYYFVIVSGGEKYDSAGLPFKALIGEETEAIVPTVGAVEASESVSPAEVAVTEVGDTWFTVTWKTATARSGWVEYGGSPDKIDQVAYDEQGQEVEDVQHQVALEGLEPGIVYYFVIVSGGEKYENAGSPFKVLIGPGAESSEPSEMPAEGV